jgi:hypothetical protein
MPSTKSCATAFFRQPVEAKASSHHNIQHLHFLFAFSFLKVLWERHEETLINSYKHLQGRYREQARVRV